MTLNFCTGLARQLAYAVWVGLAHEIGGTQSPSANNADIKWPSGEANLDDSKARD